MEARGLGRQKLGKAKVRLHCSSTQLSLKILSPFSMICIQLKTKQNVAKKLL